MKLTILVLIGGLVCQITQAEIYTASADLTNVFKLEQQVVGVLSELVTKAESKIDTIRKYLKEFESITQENIQTEDEFLKRIAGNPIHAYQMMKRLTVEWQHIEDEIKKDDWKNALKNLERVKMGARFPKEEDFHGAAQALVRLQDTYELNLTDLVRGNLWGYETRAELTAQDCLFMGKHSFNAGVYSRAVEWFEEAFILAGLEGNKTVRQDQVMEFIQHAIRMHDDSLEHGKVEYTFQQPLTKKPASEQRVEMLRNRQYKLGKYVTATDDARNFNALCRGEKLLDEKTLSRFKCWYDNKRHPYLKLHPAKIEQHFDKPAIYTFHDVIYDSEIEKIKSLAKPLLARAMVQGRLGVGHEVSNVRTSKTAWLSDNLDPLLKKLSKRISILTGLNTDSLKDEAELLQIANYGIGGHYNPHHDYLMKDKDSEQIAQMPLREIAMGDRIATFMFYLNDVERGGATAFPRVGAAVQPVKGGAAFWWNLKKSGKPDVLTLHGACPVLLGYKWVSNKWIRETGQVFKRSCVLDANE